MDALTPQLCRVQPDAPDIAAIIDAHFAQMRAQSPPESCHVLDRSSLGSPDIHLYALRVGSRAVAIGALRTQGEFAELKSMHTLAAMRGHGHGRQLLRGIIEEASAIGIKTLGLETGSGPEHIAARSLYGSFGFVECAPFPPYTADPLSVFMQLAL